MSVHGGRLGCRRAFPCRRLPHDRTAPSLGLAVETRPYSAAGMRQYWHQLAVRAKSSLISSQRSGIAGATMNGYWSQDLVVKAMLPAAHLVQHYHRYGISRY